jgi:hypothetical protein
VPMQHSDIFFRVKSDLHLVRMRLGAQSERLPERRSRRHRGLSTAVCGDLDLDSPRVAITAEP